MKRFTETDKWRDAWYLALSPNAKAMLGYIYDNCDEAGFIDVITQKWISEIKLPNAESFTAALLELQSVLLSNKQDKKLWLTLFLRQEQKLPLRSTVSSDMYIIEKLTRNLPKFGNDNKIKSILDLIQTKKQKGTGQSTAKFVEPTYDEFLAEYKKQKPDASEELDIKPCYNHYYNVNWKIGKTNNRMKSLEKLIESAIARNKKYEGAKKNTKSDAGRHQVHGNF